MPSNTCSHIRLLCPLFIPGNRADMLAKAARYQASAYIPDFEDSVPADNKDQAVRVTTEALPELTAIGRPVIPRVNSLASGRTKSELEAVVGTGLAAISIGKINSADEVLRVDDIISAIESDRNLPIGAIGILPWLETAAAIVNAYAICTASPRVRWVAFGAEDYAADMGIMRNVDSESDVSGGPTDEYGEASLLYPRSVVAVAARAAGIAAIDTPYVKFRDVVGLRAEAGLARRLGYTGKFAIHPAQLEAIRGVWTPTKSEIERAELVVAAADLGQREGRGAISLDGEMIDAPVIVRARNVLGDAQTSSDRSK